MGKMKVSVPVDDMLKVSLTSEASGDAEVQTEIKLTPAATLTVAIKNPDISFTTTEISGGLNYVDPMFSIESKFKAWDGPKVTKDDKFGTGTLGASFGLAFPIPGVGCFCGSHASFRR